MADSHDLHHAIDQWPVDVPLSGVQVSDQGPQAKAKGRLSAAQREVVRAAGWRSSSAGWWTLEPKQEAPATQGDDGGS
jgi:hypothetical protein